MGDYNLPLLFKKNSEINMEGSGFSKLSYFVL
jgi:hypothetical protein